MTLNIRLETGLDPGDAYRIETEDGCVLVFGVAPLTEVSRVLAGQPHGAVVDMSAARIMGAALAAGLPEDLQQLVTKHSDAHLAKIRKQYADLFLSDAALRWLALGDQGASSLALCVYLIGESGLMALAPHAKAHPRDPSDLRRCRLLLEQVPELQAVLPSARSLSPVWARLMDQWEALCRTMDAEAPDWRKSDGNAPKTYALLQTLIKEPAHD